MISKCQPGTSCTERLIKAAKTMGQSVACLRFAPPVSHVYNPLLYAWPVHEAYLRTYAGAEKRVVFIGMNPGPFGMVQTGVPFGEVTAVRDWLKLNGPVAVPAEEHPRRPVLGFQCERCEISGQRLWGLFAREFGTPEAFFSEHFVLNYCPLAFVESSGRNRTPDKLPAEERERLFAVCNEHLEKSIDALAPEWLIAVGDFAFHRAEEVFGDNGPRLGKILHPSPANPAANRGWADIAARQLKSLGVW